MVKVMLCFRLLSLRSWQVGAGRRGIDTLGNVIVIYDGSCEPEDYFDLATSKNYELNSCI